MSDDQDRAHPASPIQLEEAIRRGDVAHSQELGAALQNLGGLLVFLLTVGSLAGWLVQWTRSQWSNGTWTADATLPKVQQTLTQMTSQLVPMLLLFLGLAIATYWIQTGLVFRPERAMPRLDRISPTRFAGQGMLRKAFQSLLALPKMLFGIGTGAVLIGWQRDAFFRLAELPPGAAVEAGLGLLLRVSFQVALILLAFGLVDFGLEWLARQRRLQMSDQQIRDEQRMQEVDPQLVARRRQLQTNWQTQRTTESAQNDQDSSEVHSGA